MYTANVPYYTFNINDFGEDIASEIRASHYILPFSYLVWEVGEEKEDSWREKLDAILMAYGHKPGTEILLLT